MCVRLSFVCDRRKVPTVSHYLCAVTAHAHSHSRSHSGRRLIVTRHTHAHTRARMPFTFTKCRRYQTNCQNCHLFNMHWILFIHRFPLPYQISRFQEARARVCAPAFVSPFPDFIRLHTLLPCFYVCFIVLLRINIWLSLLFIRSESVCVCMPCGKFYCRRNDFVSINVFIVMILLLFQVEHTRVGPHSHDYSILYVSYLCARDGRWNNDSNGCEEVMNAGHLSKLICFTWNEAASITATHRTQWPWHIGVTSILVRLSNPYHECLSVQLPLSLESK